VRGRLHLGDEEEGFLAGELGEVRLLELRLGDLAALSGGAAAVAEVVPRGLEHEEAEPVELVVGGDDLGRSEGPHRVVERVRVEVQRKPVGEGPAGDGHAEIFEELAGLVAGVGHEVPAVGDLAGDDHAHGSVDVVDAFVGVLDEQLGDDLLLGAEDDTVAALNAEDGPEWGRRYSALSTAFAAYSSCRMRPSCV
jgi:hypothetical protein